MVEFWVVRIITRGGVPVNLEHMTFGAAAVTLGLIAAGKLAALSDGRIGEPTEVYEDQREADAERLVYMRKHPGEVFAVIMNASL